MSDVVRCDVPCDNACDSSTRMDGTKHMSEMQGVVVRRYNTVQYLYTFDEFLCTNAAWNTTEQKAGSRGEAPAACKKMPVAAVLPQESESDHVVGALAGIVDIGNGNLFFRDPVQYCTYVIIAKASL